MIYFPPPSLFFYTQTILYLLLGFGIYYLESSGKFNLPYSKFNSGSGISPQVGMFFIYFLPILGYISTFPNHSDLSFYQLTLFILFLIHFGKRCLEVLFLHQFSGKIGLIGVLFITFAYTNIGILMGTNHMNMNFPEGAPYTSAYFIIGIILFLIGQVGNFYHHLLLRNLRKTKTDKKYSIPSGGLFGYVLCPHYLFELISWLGLAIVSTHWESYVVFFVMSCYLAGRSERTRVWYLEKFPDFPQKRKRIVPIVF